MRPILMPPNRLDHFYLGGARITDLRGVPATSDRSPEEWLASVTTRFGESTTGLSALPDGRLLRDAVADDRDGWLGASHQDTFGGSTGLLVKLLDAGQRLPVHLHPDRSFAQRHLDCPFGKTEAWYVVAADPGARCHLGFVEEIDEAELAAHVATQDADALLEAMHPIEVRAGDGILVPAGLAHAIGEGIMVVEAQEPTDLSILLEWEGLPIDGERDGHIGVGFDTALRAVDRRARSGPEIADLVRNTADASRSDALLAVLPDAAAAFFRVELARPEHRVAVAAGFAVVIVLDGSGTLSDEVGETAVSRGDVLAIPYATGEWALSGDATAMVCRPAISGPLVGPRS
jgi:mannose-6-phosphate isomerase